MQKIIIKYYHYWLSFLLPILLFGGVFAINKVYPFGDHSILMADEFTQYIQFYNHFYNVFNGNGSLIYSWEAGMGLNFWGTFAYYLSSPLSFIVLLFDRSHIPEAFILIILIKIGLSGFLMNIYLSNVYKGEKLIKLTFSIMYSLIGFTTGYFFNIMWLDSICLLPLVLLGVEYLFNHKPQLFILSLSLLFISNFYMAYIVGLFTFLYFLVRGIALAKLKIKKVLMFMAGTMIAGGLSAFVTLPTYLLLKTNSYQSIEWRRMLDPQFGFFEFFTKLYNSSVNLFDLPNVFCGLLPLLLAPLFFINKQVKKKEKALYFFLLVILFLSLQISGLSFIWHAFSIPSGFNFRFSFVFSFVLIILSFKSYRVFNIENVSSLIKVYLVNVIILFLLTKLTPEMMSINKALINIFILSLFAFLLYLTAKWGKGNTFVSVLILFVVCLDMSLNAFQNFKLLNSYPGYSIPRSAYNNNPPSFEKMIKELKDKDKGFYRLNSTVRVSPNDSLRYEYKGMTNFNTLSNGTLHQFMEQIGYSSTLGSRSLAQNQGILTSDALFGFKYMISAQPVNKYGYKEVKRDNDLYLYQNHFSLPIGFMLDKRQFAFNVREDNPFEKQNVLLSPANKKENYFEQLEPSSIKYNNLNVSNQGNILFVKKVDQQQEGSIEMVFDVHGKRQLYTLLGAGKGFEGFNETSIYVNGKSLGVYPTYHKERVFDLGGFTNSKVTVKIVFAVPETQLTQQLFYGLDILKFEKRVDQFRSESLHVTNWTETSVEGKIQVKKSNSLFLSIPYDKGWTVNVDGKSQSLQQLGGFVGVDLERGTHTIKLSYLPQGFKIGCIISMISLFVLILLFVYLWKKSKTGDNHLVMDEKER